MQSLRYSVVACAIRKDEHFHRYGADALDPYHLSLNVLVELFCFDVGRVRKGGLIIAEKRDHVLDMDLQQTWMNLYHSGTCYVKGRTVRNRLQDLDLRGKKENIAGLQLADLVVSPIGRHLLGKPDKEDWRIVEQKLRRGPRGEVDGYGLVSFPR